MYRRRSRIAGYRSANRPTSATESSIRLRGTMRVGWTMRMSSSENPKSEREGAIVVVTLHRTFEIFAVGDDVRLDPFQGCQDMRRVGGDHHVAPRRGPREA